MSELNISVLGSPTVEVDGEPLQVDTRKATALLVYLAVTGRPQSRDHLTGLLWPDYDQERARAALRRTLSALRKALGDRWVSADRLGVGIDERDLVLDLDVFRRRLSEAEAHGHLPTEPCRSCVETLTAAIELSGGRFLQGFALRDAEAFEEWQTLESEAVERELHGALDMLVRALVAAGDLDRAASAAQRKLARDPLDEPSHRRLMQIYAWRGMRSQALQQYRDCVAVLDRELGVPPLAETTALYEAIADGSVAALEESDLPEPPDPAVQPPAPKTSPLRGRAKERSTLDRLHAAVQDTGAFVVIEGEAGIGKTRLAQEFLVGAAERRALVTTARAYEGETGVPYALVTQLVTQLLGRGKQDPGSLAEVGRLVPGAAPVDPLPSTEDPGAPARFLEGVRRVLVAGLDGPAPGVLFLDDLQWCDSASLEVLAYVVRRLEETPLFVVGAWRSEDVDHDHPLERLTAGAIRDGLGHRVPLGRLSPDEVRAIVTDSRATEGPDVEALTGRLVAETEGIPFFIVEYLNVMSREGGSDWRMPATIKELLRQRAASVGQTARQVLGAAAAIDRSFDFETVWRASGRTELETLDALDELVAHGLVSAVSDRREPVYEFSHDKLRSFIYDAMSPARRRVLHRRAAEAFSASAKRNDAPGLAALIARHFELGGMQEEAAAHHLKAAEEARAVFANTEALDHFLAALALGHPDLARLHEGAGDMYVLLGRYDKAVDSYLAAGAHSGAEPLPALEHKLGDVHLRRGEWDIAQSHFAAALKAVEQSDDRVTESRLLAAMSFNAYRQGRIDDAVTLAERSVSAARDAADPRSLAKALNQMGILDNARARLPNARAGLEESLALAVELDDVGGRVAALNNLAHTSRLEGDLEGALELAEEALDLCVQQGDSHREAALHNNIADLLHESGRTTEAMDHLKQATTTLAEIGQEPAGMLPEVWKLVEW